MNKTLHKTTNKKSLKFYSSQIESLNSDQMFSELAHQMKGYLREAAKDILQPRPQAISDLLKKAATQA